MTGSKLSAPTVHDILMKAGNEPVTMRLGRVYKSFERPFINDLWQIDYVELGTDIRTGRKVESLSVIDDNSRFIFSANARTTATTDDVLEILDSIIAEYGAPKAILSDHGTQWAANNGGDTRFDEWCERHGILHIMGQVRKPTTQGKVERWHGSLRRETNLPPSATLQEYQKIMERYVDFYNNVRPHWSCGLRTPGATYKERHKDLAIASLASMESSWALCCRRARSPFRDAISSDPPARAVGPDSRNRPHTMDGAPSERPIGAVPADRAGVPVPTARRAVHRDGKSTHGDGNLSKEGPIGRADERGGILFATA